jgi:hypothetical protein
MTDLRAGWPLLRLYARGAFTRLRHYLQWVAVLTTSWSTLRSCGRVLACCPLSRQMHLSYRVTLTNLYATECALYLACSFDLSRSGRLVLPCTEH